jgi:hypothetical protein
MGILLGPGAFSQKLTTLQQAQAWRERRQAQREEYQALTSAAATGLSAATSNQIDETVKLAAQVALDRIQAAAKAKFEKASATAAPAVKEPPATVYAGASEIDLASGTVKLPGGKKLDVRTGVVLSKTV